MKTIDINTTLIDGYLRLLDNLSPNNKLDLKEKFEKADPDNSFASGPFSD